ncbi:MAG: hypothetical protein MUF84_02235 [Anaerolineae bacterium]|jgi:hypothetical protein|nr:hypothetical protein [Anaerolineae bacterium]
MSERSVILVLRGIGALMLAVGIGALVVAPLEMICFSWFSEGGRFGYKGFGFGSFMFGNLAMQILGYYGIAVLTIPLGYGHWMLRRWVRPVMLALLRIWWVLGVPLLVVFLLVLLMSKDLTIGAAIAVAGTALFSYSALPVILSRLYRCDGVSIVLERGDSSPTWADRLGVSTLVVLGLQAFWVVALHLLFFFRGMFPLLTRWATGLTGLALIDGAVVALLVLIWGTLRRRRWAWWGVLAYFGAMAVLWVGTLISTRWDELLAVLAFPPTEVAILGGLPIQGWHGALLVGLPLAGTVGAILRNDAV